MGGWASNIRGFVLDSLSFQNLVIRLGMSVGGWAGIKHKGFCFTIA